MRECHNHFPKKKEPLNIDLLHTAVLGAEANNSKCFLPASYLLRGLVIIDSFQVLYAYSTWKPAPSIAIVSFSITVRSQKF